MNKILYFGAALVCLLLSSCNDYLNIAPKGNKIPTTLEDFEALLRDQYTIGRTPATNALYLLNDIYSDQFAGEYAKLEPCQLYVGRIGRPHCAE